MGKREDKVRVYALDRGTVIDHIRQGQALRVLRLLSLEPETTVATGMSFDSSKLGRKDIIKFEDFFLDEETAKRIALIAPEATVSKIEGGKVIEKFQVAVPDKIEGFMSCANPKCITRNEPMKTKFTRAGDGEIKFRCHYCERKMDENDVRDHLL